ncbi:hypothetical protein NCS56_01327000 [Fusarium sp. Ph1]|nr:hypothetical protein NCS56_01327000 [Fusarium sp. Ph1]
MDAASVEINDGMFCAEHLREVCEDCSADFREENDAFYGFDTADRDPLSCPSASQNGDGVYECKKHRSGSMFSSSLHAFPLEMQTQLTSPELAACAQCFSWKKQIVRARHAAKAEGR